MDIYRLQSTDFWWLKNGRLLIMIYFFFFLFLIDFSMYTRLSILLDV